MFFPPLRDGRRHGMRKDWIEALHDRLAAMEFKSFTRYSEAVPFGVLIGGQS
jgi:hypothetical protein